MDPELVVIDVESVKRAKGIGVFPQQTTRNIPKVYERPQAWPATRTIAHLPSAVGFTGSGRTVHPQSQVGSSWNWPAFVGLSPQGPGGVIMQALRDRLTNLTSRF